ncbi:eukaryotic translation initiation factor 4E-1, putative [Pediculus humanus corporis]|uniref:Eukaryotic translation initiation factor 4E-1, putative n=1 Tax=Pediculus humanus subsp. corporis TaxID=121224 RepID=E0VFC0_PEDHC|nr:eukaryotic translation initiation factor 4E-1, putative [Pediculus humanus corporis]EEB12076.1 eukaryotic translation initiation factor 4E-1, putative [Pediculus humanus corporis]
MASSIEKLSLTTSENDFSINSQFLKCSNVNFPNNNETTNETPLQTSWTFWLDKAVKGSKAREYETNLSKIYTFDTIQGFWSVYNNLPDVKGIQIGYSYHMMRDERRPIWEEPYNQNGGVWRFRCNKDDTSKVWKELILAAIGEQFSESITEEDEICGLTVSVREKFDTVKIWNSKAELESQARFIELMKHMKITFGTQELIDENMHYDDDSFTTTTTTKEKVKTTVRTTLKDEIFVLDFRTKFVRRYKRKKKTLD